MIEVNLSGPLFTGALRRNVERAIQEAAEELADEGEDRIHRRFDTVLREPTGYLDSQVTVEPAGNDVRITDGGVIYGPWIEGTGSRNATTRFKGYRTYREVAQDLDRDAERIAEPIIRKVLR